MQPSRFRSPRRTCLAVAFASMLGASCVAAAQDRDAAASPPTLEELARRLQALEARQGDTIADEQPLTAVDLDRRLRALERRQALQDEAAAAKPNDYVAGIYNGAPDGRDAATSNPDDEFEFAGRLFFEPWRGSDGALSGLGFGIAGSVGDKRGDGNDFLPRYRTPGQAQFFGYRDEVFADGEHRRWSPQGYWYRGAFGMLGEYVSSTQALRLPDGTRASPDNRAWQLTAGYVLTGEDAGYRGVTKPNRPFEPGAGGWGAFEVVARHGRLEIDDAVFPLFADPADAAALARAWALGLNWYLTTHLKLVASYTRTRFDGGADGGDREDEQAFFTRAQLSF